VIRPDPAVLGRCRSHVPDAPDASGVPDAPSVAQDPVHDAVDAIRSPGTLEARLAEAWSSLGYPGLCAETRILRTHYRPFVRARILAEVTGIDPRRDGAPCHQYLFIQVYPSAAQARRRFATVDAKHALACAGPPVVPLDDLNALVWVLPNGPRLRPGKIGFRPRKLRKILRRLARSHGLPPETIPQRPPLPKLVRYVPRRRALFRHRAPEGAGYPSVYIKVYAPDAYRIARRNHKLIRRAHRAGELDFQPPRVLLTSGRRRCIVLKRLRGKPFTKTIKACRTEEFAGVGSALGSLHRCSIRPASVWTPDLELTGLRDAVRDMRAALPPLAPRLDALVDRFVAGRAALAFDQRAPIHGNLFGDQILLRRGCVRIVDWDDLCYGDPMFDVGRMLAHACLVCRRKGVHPNKLARASTALLEAYSASVGHAPAGPRLAWQTAVALLLRAKISALRPLTRDWQLDIAACVQEAERIMDGRSDWFPAGADD